MSKTYSKKTHFKSQTFLNSKDSPSTGSIVCYDGDIEYCDEEGMQPCCFVEIADCHNKVRLHKTHTDTYLDFTNKLDTLINVLTEFRNHFN